ncbi:hypoxanthine phosphoribosyltransferase [Chitinophaga ginsengisegetis]|jgi:hypoxanthine phosphoribosyltransferase|uniref:Hypoxanthine phosphoribosyltransferase n=1 Tax=Chitinophaga ginsengisegetis TaxID=393003 RepID=A0A1T5NKU7_9BACT|nr:hypoxanthine phosphoribosyltransferase [Chitinophaga ginsengisegetis]MDR6565249.1 hypoxanthine phosphoribosyltransferase [Chitinophaga ginsengisegetis]MDR6644976.1 hypoxanthine phosphoribosyltransferase [Chitinophaga ginsengisegetis]MDR6652432.1 hypoxanthine phosphoribosyltransferase [Chitinophaga ginsengisegetis]SKD01260.1 hypoxanthine phosphoribosyltransferase [Chitinophaga ginsengisegetis]
MSVIKVHDKEFQPYIDEVALQQRVKEMAEQINKDLKGERPLFIAILNGSFMFAADVFKYLTIEAEISFIKLASYKGTKSTGNVVQAIGLDEDLFGRTVVILEDIVDTGRTMSQFLPQLEHQQPKKLLVAALLTKPDAMVHPIKIDYLGFSVPDKFLLGYGLDYDGLGRNLPAIYQLVESGQ